MRAFIFIFFTLVCCSVFLGCKTGENLASNENHAQIIVHDKLIPVFRPSDSASIRALLECDSNGRVLLSWFDMAQSENAKLKFQLDSMGNLLADFKVPSDTVYVQGKDSTIIKAEVKYIEVERKRNSWEKFCIGFTIIALLSIIAFVILKLRSIIKF